MRQVALLCMFPIAAAKCMPSCGQGACTLVHGGFSGTEHLVRSLQRRWCDTQLLPGAGFVSSAPFSLNRRSLRAGKDTKSGVTVGSSANNNSRGTHGSESDGLCQMPLDSTPCDMCSNKALDAVAFNACIACHAAGKVNPYECSGCLEAPDAASQKRCYQCITKSGLTSSTFGCASCYGAWLQPGLSSACVECVESPTTPMAAKAECGYCFTLSSTADRSKCLACLHQPHSNYSEECELFRKLRRRLQRLAAI